MIRLQCPGCSKKLGIPTTMAGRVVACPQCSHRFRVPAREKPEADGDADEQHVETVALPASPTKKRRTVEDHEEQAEETEAPEHGLEGDEPPPRPRKKKKRRRPRPAIGTPGRGRLLVLLVCAVVLGMHIVSLVTYLATPDPMELAKQQVRASMEKMGGNLPKDFEQNWERDMDKAPGVKEMQDAARRGQLIGLAAMIGGFALSVVLLTFLYLRHNWARMVLGVLFLIGAGLGLLGIATGGLVIVALYPTGAAILTILEMLVREAVSLGVGLLLILSPSVIAYTSER
ncbi:MAG TPA: hypothetical protein VMS17_05910 [Gemmataceae bacterium]|nr:hypothetical protein [Gemmataceae bacterium]